MGIIAFMVFMTIMVWASFEKKKQKDVMECKNNCEWYDKDICENGRCACDEAMASAFEDYIRVEDKLDKAATEISVWDVYSESELLQEVVMFGLSVMEWLVIGIVMVVCSIGSYAEWKNINK